MGPKALARAKKAQEEWEGAGRPILKDFAKRFGYREVLVRQWSAELKWQSTVPKPVLLAVAEAVQKPLEPGDEELLALGSAGMLQRGQPEAILALYKLATGRIPCSAGVQRQAALSFVELSGYRPEAPEGEKKEGEKRAETPQETLRRLWGE